MFIFTIRKGCWEQQTRPPSIAQLLALRMTGKLTDQGITVTSSVAVPMPALSAHLDAIKACSKGEPVLLMHERHNEHDPRAIAVLSIRQDKIGNLPRNASWLREAMLDDAQVCAATIAGINLKNTHAIWLDIERAAGGIVGVPPS
jgi:hypothetical protein